MGLLIDGEWRDQWYDTKETEGRFVRKTSSFREKVERSEAARFAPESGRYHLYVSLACPWAHRTLIVRKLKKLEAVVSVSVVDPLMGSDGWTFGKGGRDEELGVPFLRDVYVRADASYTGRVTVPVLWDRKHETIVNNESSEILRMLNSEFEGFGDDSLDLYPEALREEIDAVNEFVYPNINDGVYRCGFATTQQAYEEAFHRLFSALDTVDGRLSGRRYLLGERLTEADVRLFTTLVRFDPVYVGHFKCNLRRISDYPHLAGYLRELYQQPGVRDTVNFEHIKHHYHASHRTINPTGIVPLGPELDLDAPHGRDHL